jgi:Holliday junction resolvasome RuvABC endonuclease subunit
MTKVLGLDCSSKAVHGVLLDEHGELLRIVKWASKKTDTDERLEEIAQKMSAEIVEFLGDDEVFVTIEKPILIQNGHATISISQVVGAAKAVLVAKAIKFLAVDNKTWKRAVLGDGSAKKDKIFKFAQMKWGENFTEQDHADAACISMWGVKRFGKEL